jgi:hypothetical protein
VLSDRITFNYSDFHGRMLFRPFWAFSRKDGVSLLKHLFFVKFGQLRSAVPPISQFYEFEPKTALLRSMARVLRLLSLPSDVLSRKDKGKS